MQQQKAFASGQDDVSREHEGCGIGEIVGDQRLVQAANDMIGRWERWLRSGMYGMIVQARLEEWVGVIGSRRIVLGQSERKGLERAMRRYVLVDEVDPKLFYRERNGELASCILEVDIPKVLRELYEGHGHFATRIALGLAHGKVYYPSQAQDIG